MIGLAALASGSDGNGLLLRAGGDLLLLDCGLPPRELVRRLALVGQVPGDLTGVVVTHEHGDHVGGVADLALAFGLPVYGTAGTLRAVVAQAPRLPAPARAALARLCRPLAAGEAARAGGVTLHAVSLLHDACEPVAYLLEAEGVRVGVATDLGTVTPAVVETLAGADVLVLEFNHDEAMLAGGPYPPPVKRRIAGARGHLSNAQAAGLLAAAAWPGLRAVWLAHLSRVNNRPVLALEAARGALRGRLPFEDVAVSCLAQDQVRPFEDFAGPAGRDGGGA